MFTTWTPVSNVIVRTLGISQLLGVGDIWPKNIYTGFKPAIFLATTFYIKNKYAIYAHNDILLLYNTYVLFT